MFNSPTKTDFKVYLPDFLPNDMNNIFSQYLFNETTIPYKDVKEAFFEGQVLSFEIPDLGIETVGQTTNDGGVITQLPPRFTHDQYGDNRFVVNIRCIDAYINYHIARYAFMIYTNPKTNEDPSATGVIGDVIINFNGVDSLFKLKLVYRNCVWVGVDGKEFSYDQTIQRFDQFGLIFRHNGFDVIPELNKKVAKSKGLKIDVVDVDNSKRNKNGINLVK